MARIATFTKTTRCGTCGSHFYTDFVITSVQSKVRCPVCARDVKLRE